VLRLFRLRFSFDAADAGLSEDDADIICLARGLFGD
jgi:hypothetical protein